MPTVDVHGKGAFSMTSTIYAKVRGVGAEGSQGLLELLKESLVLQQ